MDLLKVILREHTRQQAEKITVYVGSDKQRFAELVRIFLKGPYRVTQRAAWPLSLCVERHPPLAIPHLKKFIEIARQPAMHQAVRRNVMRLLQFIDIPARHQGAAAQLGFDLLSDTSQPVAIRVFSMQVVANLCEKNPGLKRELIMSVEAHLPYASAGYIARAKKILKKLKA